MRPSPHKLVLLTTLTLACTAHAQVTANASIGLVARLPGSVTLTEHLVSVTLVVRDGAPETVMVPVDVRWNLDPRETQSFRVVARFVGDGPISKSNIHARMEGGVFRDFPEKGGQLVLFNVPITARNRQGHEQRMVELKIDNEAAASLANGVYRGRLSLEVRQD